MENQARADLKMTNMVVKNYGLSRENYSGRSQLYLIRIHRPFLFARSGTSFDEKEVLFLAECASRRAGWD